MSYQYNDLEEILITDGEVYMPDIGLYITNYDHKPTVLDNCKLYLKFALYIICILSLFFLPILEIVMGTLYNNIQCEVMNSVTVPVWMIVKGSLNIYVIIYLLYAIYIRNIQIKKNRPIGDHPNYEIITAMTCPTVMCIGVMMIWTITGVSAYILNCKNFDNGIMNELMKWGLIFEFIKYVLVLPLVKW